MNGEAVAFKGIRVSPVGRVAGLEGSGPSEISIQSFDSDGSDAAFFGGFDGVVIEGSNVHANDTWIQNEWWIIDQLTQINRTLTVNDLDNVPDPLRVAETIANFRIFDVESNLLTSDLGSETTFEFFETPNRAAGCDVNIEGTALCSDVYRVTLGSFAPLTPFQIDNFIYSIDFTLIPGPTFDDSGNLFGETLVSLFDDPRTACAGANVPEGQIYVYTPEFNPGESNIYVAARWTATAVPEPSMLVLFGAGLVGLGFAARRRKQDQS